MFPEQGLLTIYRKSNIAEKGLSPVFQLIEVSEHFYDKRTIGVTRLYAAKGANSQIDDLVRIDVDFDIDVDMVVIPENGQQYRIDAIQELRNDDGLYVMDLSLVRVEKFYDIAE